MRCFEASNLYHRAVHCLHIGTGACTSAEDHIETTPRPQVLQLQHDMEGDMVAGTEPPLLVQGRP
jgi:hypothetical protein